MTIGRIFDIQRYSIHDGRGIRTIVFLKGCFLRCRWCCNPESQNYEIETMDSETVGKDVTVDEVMEEVEKDRAYYRRSDGGLTLSGGEPLRQPDFTKELLQEATKSGIHTSLESTAMAEFSIIEKLLPYLDELLLDIKHMDPAKHEEFTGKRNEIVLENAKKIAESRLTKLTIRVPVMPGFNATTSEILNIARFAASLKGPCDIHLLPYHRYGEGKYEALGREYKMKVINPPDDYTMQDLKKAITETTNLFCQIGG